MNDQLPRSANGGLMYCLRCPTAISVPRGGVKLCPDCRAAHETAQAGTTDQAKEQQQP